jgi:hypothetical protein
VQRAPQNNQVRKEHLDLLKNFGRNKSQRKSTKKQKEQLWQMACQACHLNYVPLEAVIAEWKRLVVGESKSTNIAMSNGIDPNYLTLGVCHSRQSVAAHTCLTKSHLFHVLRLFRQAFPSDEAFLQEVSSLSYRSIGKNND